MAEPSLGRIVPVELETEMRRSYIDYAMSVIVDRALPDVRDGLKPVQRRILHAMNELNLRPDRPYKKSAAIVGEVMGKYHPHGDAPIYDAMVRMAQDFSYRYMLVDGHGNFGCFTGETRLWLADGTQKSFQELQELGRDARFPVYAIDPATGGVVVAWGRNARLTRRDARLVEVVLDSGARIRCTPDHRFMFPDGTYREARFLVPGDGLMAMELDGGTWGAGLQGRHTPGRPGQWVQAPERPALARASVKRVQSVRSLAERADVYDITVDGYHNFLLACGVFVHNSVDGDPPAAMRYTEARLSPLAMEMLRDIDKETVDFVPNYDGSEQQPVVLPARVPNLLINGASGIAVGMATNIPPHNLAEIVDALVLLIDQPDVPDERLLEVVKGPDFPTGGVILGTQGIRDAYLTGRGHIRVRARVTMEPMGGGRTRIVVTELPYMVNKAALIEKIAELVRERRIDGISEVRDESDREGLRVAIELRRDAQPHVVLNRLFKHTPLEDTFGVIMLALVDGQPQVLTLREALRHYLDFQVEVITRRTRFDLRRAQERLHIVEGLRVALDHIDAIIQLIRSAPDEATAREGLMTRFGLSERQASAILEMQLRRLTRLERSKLEQEHQELVRTIEELTAILGDVDRVYGVIRQELLELRQRFADPRRTEISAEVPQVDEDALVALEDIVITLTHNGYIKRQATSTYRSQRRGGRGIAAMATREEDFVEHLFIATTHTRVLLFTDRGRMFHVKGREIPEASRNARGTPILNLLPMSQEESVAAAIAVTSFDEGRYLFMATRNGVVKKTPLPEFQSVRQGIIACELDEGDRLVGVRLTGGQQEVLLVTRQGQAIRFPEEEVRPMGRGARGVRGIRLEPGDRVVAMDAALQGADVLVVTEQGYGKRTPVSEFRLIGRGGKGVRATQVTDKTGPVVGMRVVEDDDELMLISSRGVMIRLRAADVSRQGRTARGVLLMRLDPGDTVAAMAQVAATRNGPEAEEGEDS